MADRKESSTSCVQHNHSCTIKEPEISPPKVVFILGPPGAGKGTLCKKLARELEYYHLSVGDYLRELCSSARVTSCEAFGGMSITDLRTHLEELKLLPADIVTAIVAHKIRDEHKAGHTRFLVDGFPRQERAGEFFDAQVTRPTAVIVFDCPRDVAKARFVTRRRGNDDSQVFATRYAEYKATIDPLVARYSEQLVLFDTSGKVEKTYEELLHILAKV